MKCYIATVINNEWQDRIIKVFLSKTEAEEFTTEINNKLQKSRNCIANFSTKVWQRHRELFEQKKLELGGLVYQDPEVINNSNLIYEKIAKLEQSLIENYVKLPELLDRYRDLIIVESTISPGDYVFVRVD